MVLIYFCHIWEGSNLVKGDDNQREHIRVKDQRVGVQSIWSRGSKVKEWEFKLLLTHTIDFLNWILCLFLISFNNELTGFGFLSGKIPGHFEITYLAASCPDFFASKHSSCIQPENRNYYSPHCKYSHMVFILVCCRFIIIDNLFNINYFFFSFSLLLCILVHHL